MPILNALFQQLGIASIHQLSRAGILQSIVVHKSPYLVFAMAFLASVKLSMVPRVSVQRVLLDKRSMLSQCFQPFRLYAGTTVLIVLTNLFFRFLDDLRVRFRQPCFAVLSVELSEFHVVVRRRVLQ